ncbi:MAG: hypothetical protein KKE30_13665 [Gammaproteobacteria bacterium]|nr:hypothetical protein [Gammaproteobacteria bacterium]MBU1556609.1 hypothetical protein [Gammaproteobacteria bacterium]MBU2069734.1 hypothetical protein [Gammaproteobacteria bacterium]MBU2184599.1 hypothetical protein [Gammaproteobacteria bacterium]MBU2205735.1 hypothetical protein [Gammaproteobacteria bacterium]
MRRRTLTKQNAATDCQILRLHSAMADKLLAQPELVTQVLQTLEQRYQAGLLRHSGYIHWYSILDCINEPKLFRSALLDDSERMRKLRRRTVLVGILTEDERQAVLVPNL